MLVARELDTTIERSLPMDVLSLPYDRRQHSRQRASLEGGEHIALMLSRGTVLRDGDVLFCEGGRRVRVRAAPESVSRVSSRSARELTRAAYHLGNRHVPTELGAGYVAYLHDHVLDEMIRRLGLQVSVVRAPFEPEAGAYGHSGIAARHEHGDHQHGQDEHDHHSDEHPVEKCAAPA